jgi:hypothetical protein
MLSWVGHSTRGQPLKIFLSYPSEHELTAWKVYNLLKKSGDEIWFDKVSLVGGTDWDRERDEGQREADLAIHLLSEAIRMRAGVVNVELRQTLRLAEHQPFGSLYVIPIRLEPIVVPVELIRFQYIDLFVDGWQDRLSDGVEQRRAQLSGRLPEPCRLTIAEKIPLHELHKIEFEDITAHYECNGEYLRYDRDGLYWTYVNSAIASHALASCFTARSDFIFVLGGDDEQREGRKHIWSINVEELFKFEDMISIRFYTYIGYARAAHPIHYVTTLNFIGEKAGSLKIEQLLASETSADKILTYCERVIIAECGDLFGSDSLFDAYKHDKENIWKLIGQFNFDKRGLIFNFSPYDVLPFVFGIHDVLVPWRFLDELFHEDYRDVFEKLNK